MGGGGFSSPPGDPSLDRYVLEVARVPHPRICLLPTAGGDAEDQIRRFYAAYRHLPCEPTHLSLFRLGAEPVDVASVLLGQDVLYVGGGSMLNLLAVWRAHGVDAILREAWERGVLLCGWSAGMICWFEASVTDSFGPELAGMRDGLGFLPGSACPHYDGEKDRRPTFHRLIRQKMLPPGVAADDGAAIHFIGETIHRCVASRRRAKAYRLTLEAGRVVEETLPTDDLP
jgi:dipeptidase E